MYLLTTSAKRNFILLDTVFTKGDLDSKFKSTCNFNLLLQMALELKLSFSSGLGTVLTVGLYALNSCTRIPGMDRWANIWSLMLMHAVLSCKTKSELSSFYLTEMTNLCLCNEGELEGNIT